MPLLDDFLSSRPANAARPLLGLTVLVVEDSRYASEAMRLLCLRSGARIRRADSLHNARRHLCVYRPSAVIVDLGLPDGSGTELIAELANANPRVDVLIGTSGDAGGEAAAAAAGADGFIGKPIARISEFQTAVLRHLPADRQPGGLRVLTEERVNPDPMAYRDDLELVSQLLSDGWPSDRDIAYVTQFLGGVARSAEDAPLSAAVAALAAARADGAPGRAAMARVSTLVAERLVIPAPL